MEELDRQIKDAELVLIPRLRIEPHEEHISLSLVLDNEFIKNLQKLQSLKQKKRSMTVKTLLKKPLKRLKVAYKKISWK